jgi:hypothetical protein
MECATWWSEITHFTFHMESATGCIESTGFHAFMNDTPWAFPAGETIHFMALTALIGSILVVDLRAMGLLRIIPFKEAHKLVVLAMIAFGFNVFSGLMFVFTSPGLYFVNMSFWFKMLFIALAGLNALAFELFVYRPVAAGNATAEDGALAKILAALSLVFWMTVLILGRFLPFTEV